MSVRPSPWLFSLLALGTCLLLAACGVQVATPTPLPPPTVPPSPTSAVSGALTRRTPVVVAEEASTPTPANWSSAQVTQAEAAGTLGHADALLYRLYAAYAPDQLPAAYRANDQAALALTTPPADSGLTRKNAARGSEGTAVFAQIRRDWAQLSPAIQAQIRPFLQRPTQSASFWYPQSDTAVGGIQPAAESNPFAAVDVAATSIRLWYLRSGGSTAKDQATRLAAEIDRSGMWDKERQVMLGHTPCSDAGLADNGGDGRLDVYLVPPGGKARHFDPGGKGNKLGKDLLGLTLSNENDEGCPYSDFILLNNEQEWDGLRTTMAHELFHAFQDSFTVGDDADWWVEATATWAEDVVYPTVNSEQDELVEGGWADYHGALGPLDTYEDGGLAQYGAYIWPYYLTHRPGGDPTLIGQIYGAIHDQSPLALMHAWPDWDARFKEFALWNWNQAPVQLYRDNGAPITPLTQSPIAMGYRGAIAAGQDPVANRVNLRHASMIYYQLAAVNDGPNGDNFAHQLLFDLSELRGQEGLGVQAIITVGDPARPTRQYVEDWSNARRRLFCRDLPQEAVSSIVLVVTNSTVGRGTNLDGHITVEALATACQ